jgi:hypothetical protein
MSEPTEADRQAGLHLVGNCGDLRLLAAGIAHTIAAARAEGWRAAHHAWQDWLEANIPDWDAMAGIDLTTLPREPK